MQNGDFNIVHALDDEILVINNLREVENLSQIRLTYHTLVYCRGGRILVEVGGSNQVNVKPGQLLLIPQGKLVQPMLVSTDIEAKALLVSDRMLKSILGYQINIWNKATYMKEIYVLEKAEWLVGLQGYSGIIFRSEQRPQLFHEIVTSFLRTMLLMVCEELLKHETMIAGDDLSTTHDKEIFNQFLQLLSQQKQKRQRVVYYASLLNISPKYLSTICKRVSGKSSMRWIIDSVMQDCYTLLKETDLSVKEISNELGFPNASFFGQYFREQAGSTPIEYRSEHKRIAR